MEPQQQMPPQGQQFTPPQQPGMYPTPTQGPLAPAFAPMPTPPSRRKPVGLILALVVVTLLFIGALGFGFYAFSGMQDYKTNSDKKVALAVTAAKEAEASSKDKEYAEKEKSPYKTYLGPATYGALSITYPKTWSAFVTETSSGGSPVDGYMHPNFVPGTQSGTAFALRFQVLSQSYANEVKKFESLTKSGKVKVSPYKLPKVPGVTGIRVEGQINPTQQGVMIILPLRDKTIEVSTQSTQFVGDLDGIILANLVFQP